jgi:glucose-1-phosphate thymidylyltransferase
MMASNGGMNISYAIQPRPEGIAQAFLIGADFIGNSRPALILGDNIFFGHNLVTLLKQATQKTSGATIFGYHVQSPERYGVIELDSAQRPLRIEEKPKNPKSNYAVTGLYFYDEHVVQMAKGLKPSARGELEITDLNKLYLEEGNLHVQIMGRGFTWLDAGTHDSLLEAGNFVATLQKRQGMVLGCPEEIAFHQGWINKDQLQDMAKKSSNNAYGQYLYGLIK